MVNAIGYMLVILTCSDKNNIRIVCTCKFIYECD